MLIGAGLLIALSLLAASVSRYTGIDTYPPTAAAVASRDLRFEDRPDGAVNIINAEDGSTLEVLVPGTGGFLRATLRGLARERRREDVGAAPPFRLTGYADGRLTLTDPTTGRRVDLEAFGPANVQAFSRLLTARSATP
jgi:putative photosynthetic complex assembly protein